MKKIKVILLLLFGFALSLLFACNKEERTFLLSNPEKNIFEIRNDGNKDAEFSMTINGMDMNTEKNIISYIQQMEDEYPEEPLEMKAFRFVRDYTWHDDLVTKYNWAYSPYVLVNSMGGGLCGFRSAVLTNILLELGFDAKSWSLEGHVVTEVFSENKWILLDSDYGVYYYNKDKRIASYSELVYNPALITNPINPILDTDNVRFIKVYSGEMAELYYTIDDNVEFDTKYESALKSSELWFYIPANAKMTFPVNKELQGTYYAYAQLDLPADFIGRLPMPLVIAGFVGNGLIEYQGEKYYTDGFEAVECIYKNPKINWEIEIIENNNGLGVIYYINPLLFGAKEKNEIFLKGSNLQGINICFSKNENISLILPYQKDLLYKKLDSIVRDINTLAITENSEFNTTFLIEYFILFIEKLREDEVLKNNVDFEGFEFDCDSIVKVFRLDSLTDYSLFLKPEYAVPSLRQMLKNRLKRMPQFENIQI